MEPEEYFKQNRRKANVVMKAQYRSKSLEERVCRTLVQLVQLPGLIRSACYAR
jgi:hypothetical protein